MPFSSAGMAFLEAALFFIILGVTFQSVSRLEISQHFKKDSVKHIQIFYIFLAIALSYLVLKAIMNLIELSIRIFM